MNEISLVAGPSNRIISVVIPVYQNSSSLEALFEEIKNLESDLLRKNISTEFLFIDDGSSDDSLNKLRNKKKNNWKIISLTRNFGAINAVMVGLNHVKGDMFTILAADLQDPPNLILEMVAHWERGQKFIVCERLTRTDPFLSRLFSRIYYFFLRKFVVPDYPKGGYDLFLADKDLLKYFINGSKSVHPQILAWWLGFKPVIIKYERRKRIYGKSQWTFKKKSAAFFDIWIGFSKKPMRLVLSLGLFISSLSFIYGSYFLVATLINRLTPPGYASLVVLITFFAGIIILLIGLIGEYLIRMYEEQNLRPNAVVDHIYE